MTLNLTLAAVGTFNCARQLFSCLFSREENEDLPKTEEQQAEDKRTQEPTSSQLVLLKQNITELTTKLKSAATENRSLWRQVTYLTNELHRAKTWSKQQCKLFCKEEQTLRITLGQELEKTKSQLAHQKNQEELLMRESKREIEILRVSCQEIHQRYETELRVEKYKRDTIQQQLERAIKFHAKKESEYQEQIRRLTAEKDNLQQKMERQINLLQQDASEREKSFQRELEDLKVKLQEQTSTNIEKEALHTETQTRGEIPQLMDELKYEVCQQEDAEEEFLLTREGDEEESYTGLQAPELLTEAQVSEEKVPEKKRRPSFWKEARYFGLRKKKNEK